MLVVPAESAPSAEFVVKKRDNSSFGQVVGAAWSAASASQVLTDAGIDPATVAAASSAADAARARAVRPEPRHRVHLRQRRRDHPLFIAIFTFGTWVLTGVVEEKQSRVVEVVPLDRPGPRPARRQGPGDRPAGPRPAGDHHRLRADDRDRRPGGSRCHRRPDRRSRCCCSGSGSATRSTRPALGVLGALASRMEGVERRRARSRSWPRSSYVFALLVAIQNPDGVAAPDRDVPAAGLADDRAAPGGARRDRAVGGRRSRS